MSTLNFRLRQNLTDFLLVRIATYLVLFRRFCAFFGLLTPPLFHPNFGVFGVPVAPDRPYWGQRAHISLKLFGREIISEEFKPI